MPPSPPNAFTGAPLGTLSGTEIQRATILVPVVTSFV